MREYVNEAFCEEMLQEVERRVNAALVSELPKKLRKKAHEVVIDIHDQAFYGQSSKLLKYASRGQAKAGTTYFYRIARVYLIYQGMRVTLGIVFVHSGMSLARCVVQLIKQVNAQKIKLGCLFLDRGFASIEVYRCLQRRRIPALIACPIRGKNKGTKALCQGRQSYSKATAPSTPFTHQGRATVPRPLPSSGVTLTLGNALKLNSAKPLGFFMSSFI
jgi:putative transposase